MMPSALPQQPASSLVSGDLFRTGDALRAGGAVVAATLLVAVCAHVSLVLPFTPVPIVLSDMAVLLVGLLLGPPAGAAALLLYLGEGAAGAPVFSPHGPGGVAQLFGPTGGFLLSYPLVAFLAGWVADMLRARVGRPLASVVGGITASLPLFLAGALWIKSYLHLSSAAALQLAVTPFLGAAAAKIAVAAALVSSLHRLTAPSRN